MATKQRDVFTLSFRVDRTTYEIYNSLSEKAKKKLRKLIKIIILSLVNDDFKDILEISAEIKLNDDTKEFIRDVIKDSDEIEGLAREAVAFIQFLLNASEMAPGSCELIEVNKTKVLLLLERAKKLLS